MRPARLALAAAALATCAAAAPAARACPTSCMWTPPGPDYCTSAAVFDSTFTYDPGSLCSNSYDAHFHVPAGVLSTGAISGLGGCTPRLTVTDDFTVYGLPDGTLLNLTARMDVTASAASTLGGGFVAALLREGASNSASKQWNIPGDFPGLGGTTHTVTLTVPVAAVAGTPFHMTFQLSGQLGALCAMDESATFTFDGLPFGPALVSCNGFTMGTMPAHAASWGQVKAAYR